MKIMEQLRAGLLFLFQIMVYIINRFINSQKIPVMEDKNFTPRESIEIIARMIEASKQRRTMPDLRISIMWAVVTIVSAAIVLTVSLIDYTPRINLVWFAIPAVGLPATFIMEKKSGRSKGVKTAIDIISDGIWQTVGTIAIALSVICLALNILGYPEAWRSMFYFAFIIVGFGAAVQGIVLKENSYRFGGIFSILAGFALVALDICGFPMLIIWVIPLYIICFVLMFIVPAIIIRKKFNSANR